MTEDLHGERRVDVDQAETSANRRRPGTCRDEVDDRCRVYREGTRTPLNDCFLVGPRSTLKRLPGVRDDVGCNDDCRKLRLADRDKLVTEMALCCVLASLVSGETSL